MLNPQQRYLRVVSGEARSAGASAARAGLALLEPLYAAVTGLRNASFDRGWRRAVALERPVISVGNLTVGGTGKTPLVAWLCARFGERNLPTAVLMRGYKARARAKGDEQRLLERLLGPATPVEANADRTAAAQRVLEGHPEVKLFVLDDAFQHRQVRRDVDIVLIDATRPFGQERLLPRGLLREPLRSMARATAVIITRSSLAPPHALAEIRARIARFTTAPVFQCDFASDNFIDQNGAVTAFPGKRAVAVSGIGNPAAFRISFQQQGIQLPRILEYADHHHYTAADVAEIRRVAAEQKAPVVTTAKDWVKLEALWPQDSAESLFVMNQRIVFAPGDDQRLIEHIMARLTT